jgi:uncharacterized phage protein (TIGR02218 family)
MRQLDSFTAARLSAAATTFVRCWVVTRRDGTVFGFTEHDRDLLLGSTLCKAASGVQGSELEARLGFAVGGADLSGALVSDVLSEADLLKGLWDDAQVEAWLVDWQEPAARLLLETGSIGEIRRADSAFVAEMRAQAHRLDEELGRAYVPACSADLGDGRCGIDLDDPAYKAQGTVAQIDAASTAFRAAVLDPFEDEWFAGGALIWLSGANSGQRLEVRSSRQGGLVLRAACVQPIAMGDAFAVHAGCDKRFETCRIKFTNAVNFRGFPHIPSPEIVMTVGAPGGDRYDGGSLFT